MITRLQLAHWCDATAKVKELQREYESDYGRDYATIGIDMKKAKAELEKIEKEILSD